MKCCQGRDAQSNRKALRNSKRLVAGAPDPLCHLKESRPTLQLQLARVSVNDFSDIVSGAATTLSTLSSFVLSRKNLFLFHPYPFS